MRRAERGLGSGTGRDTLGTGDSNIPGSQRGVERSFPWGLRCQEPRRSQKLKFLTRAGAGELPHECHCHLSAPRTRLGWAAAAGCTFRGGFGIPIPPQAQLGHIQPAPALPSRQICRCRWSGEAGTGSCHPGETCLARAKDPRAGRKHWLFPCIVRFSARHRAGAGKNDSEQSEQLLISPGTFYVHVCVHERESKSDSRWLLGNTAWLRSSGRPRVRALPSTHMGRGQRDTAVPPEVASWQKDRARPLVSVLSGHSISHCPCPVGTRLPEGW